MKYQEKKKQNNKNNMPYKSKAQEAYFNIHKKELEKQGVNVNEWNQASKGMKLPEKVSKLKAMKKRKQAKIAIFFLYLGKI